MFKRSLPNHVEKKLNFVGEKDISEAFLYPPSSVVASGGSARVSHNTMGKGTQIPPDRSLCLEGGGLVDLEQVVLFALFDWTLG